MKTKSIFTSKTFWLHAINLIAVVVNRGAEIADPALVEQAAGTASIIGGIVLRAITKEPVTLRLFGK